MKKTKTELKHATTLFLLVALLVVLLPSNLSLTVEAQESSVDWDNRYSQTTSYGNGTFTTSVFMGPQVFWDGDSWEELYFEDNYATEGYYLLENAHIAAYIYDWYSVFYNPDNQRVCVDDERWIVEVWNDKTQKWREVDLYNPVLAVHNNETHLTVRRTFDTYEGTFEVNYLLWQGSRLKHDIKFTSKMEGENHFNVIFRLSGIYSDKVRHSEGTETITTERHIVSPYFMVGEDNDNLVFSEYLWSLGVSNETTGEWIPTTLKDIVFNVHAKGSKADILIGNYTLSENESLLIDPDSDTFYVGGGYDDVCEYGDGTFPIAANVMHILSYTDPSSGYYRCMGLRFRNVIIPQGSTVSAAKASFYVYNVDKSNCVIYGNDVDNALDFNDNSHVISTANRPRTSASVPWVADGIGLGWKEKTGLQGIVEEIVGRGGWSSDNAIVLLFIANTDINWKEIQFFSYDYGSQYAAYLEVTWTAGGGENNAPTNDACDSDATFDVDTYSWSNMTVSDADLVADLQTVDIQVTTSDSKVFTLRWTQATDVFSEQSDPDGICTLDVSGSARINIDSDTDKIAFKFKISVAAQKGACNAQATTTDDQDATDIDTYTAEFSINFYCSITIVDGTHSWTGLSPGDSDVLVGGDGDIDITITANDAFSIQAKGNGPLTSGSNTIPLANVEMHASDLGSAISLTTSYQNIPGLTSQTRGVDLAKSFKLWLTVPSPKEDGDYTYNLSIQVVET